MKQIFKRDGPGTVCCLICGKSSIGNVQQATRGHLTSKRHKQAIQTSDRSKVLKELAAWDQELAI